MPLFCAGTYRNAATETGVLSICSTITVLQQVLGILAYVEVIDCTHDFHADGSLLRIAYLLYIRTADDF